MIKQADRSTMPSQPEFQALVKRANDGDQEALKEMRAILDDNPAIWQHMGDMSRYARTSLLREISGGDKLIEESVSRSADELLESLKPDNCSPLELLAVERIVACWLEMHYIDMLNPLPQGATMKQQRFQLSLKESAQKRYDKSLKSLADLRRLLPSGVVPESRKAKNGGDSAKRRPVRQYDPHNRMSVLFEEEEEPAGV